MRTISIAIQKGGNGKTSTAAALASGLAMAGKRVISVDLDPQCSLSFAMGTDLNAPHPGAYEMLMRTASPESCIQQTPQGMLVAGSPMLAGLDLALSQTLGKEKRLSEALQAVSGAFDYCVSDCPPSLGTAVISALTASDELIIPAQADAFSVQAIGQLWQTIRAVRQYTNPALNIAGILLTRFNGRSTVAKHYRQELAQMATQLGTRLFETPIRECAALRESIAMQESIFRYAPKSNAALDYKQLVNEILKEAETHA